MLPVHYSMEMSASQRIIIKDCIDGMKEDVKEGSVDLVFADPPFGINFDKSSSMYGYGISRDEGVFYKDNMTPEEYMAFSDRWISQVKLVLRLQGIFVLMAPVNWVSELDVICKKKGFYQINHAIGKFEFALFTKKKYAISHYHYLIYLNGTRKKKYTFNMVLEKGENYKIDVFEFHRLSQRYKGIPHPCKLSEDVIMKFMKEWSNEGDLVVDPFAGSGTSLVAAYRTSRNYVGFEKKPEYAWAELEMIKRRLFSEEGSKEDQTDLLSFL